MKTCTLCHVEKPLSGFSMDGKRRKPRCKACICKLHREKYSDNRMIAKERASNRKFSDLMRSWIPA